MWEIGLISLVLAADAAFLYTSIKIQNNDKVESIISLILS